MPYRVRDRPTDRIEIVNQVVKELPMPQPTHITTHLMAQNASNLSWIMNYFYFVSKSLKEEKTRNDVAVLLSSVHVDRGCRLVGSKKFLLFLLLPHSAYLSLLVNVPKTYWWILKGFFRDFCSSLLLSPEDCGESSCLSFNEDIWLVGRHLKQTFQAECTRALFVRHRLYTHRKLFNKSRSSWGMSSWKCWIEWHVDFTSFYFVRCVCVCTCAGVRLSSSSWGLGFWGGCRLDFNLIDWQSRCYPSRCIERLCNLYSVFLLSFLDSVLCIFWKIFRFWSIDR